MLGAMGEPDVSVVVVHGTGTQAPGHTVTEWVESVLGFTGAAGRRAAPTAVTELPVEGGDAEPVAATVAVGGPGSADAVVVADPVLRLRVVEAHWAEAFTPPTPGDVLRWLLWFAPSFAVTQVVLEVRAMRREDAGTAPERARRRVRQLRPLAPLYSIALGLLGLAVLGPALVLAALVLVASSAVPRVRTAVAEVLGFLSQNVGDVQSFLIRPVARARMEARIAQVVTAEVRTHGREKVHVLATSQGAALTHAVLLTLPPRLRPARLTTVGGAHGRLHEIRVLQPPVWTRVPIVLTGLVWVLAVPLVGALGPVGGAAAVLGATALATLALAVAAHGRVRAFTARTGDFLPSPGLVPGVRWLDMWAPFDAVPNARPVAPPGEEYRYVVVPGEMRVLADHLAYARDWTESVPRILHHLTGHLPAHARLGAPRGVRARSPLQDPGGTGANWTPWARRDWVALALRVLPVVAALGGVLTPARHTYRAVGERLAAPVPDGALGAVTSLLDGALGLFGPTALRATGWPETAVGLVAALVLALTVGWVSTASFRVAARAEAAGWARSLDHPPVRRWSVARWTVVGTGIVVLWTALAAAAVRLLSALQ